MPYEVEIKFAIDSPEEMALRLTAIGADAGATVNQEDRYFNHPARDFNDTDEALRIRTAAGQNQLTFKGPRVDSVSKTREEIEVALPDGESSTGKLLEVLERLGFGESLIVRKKRTIWHLVYQSLPVEICLDFVDDLGTYVELESIAAEVERESVRDKLMELAEQLNLTNAERRSYLELLILKHSQV